ncbi:conserved hypothetical protein [Vibrio chagasii]|nr:conserved hypothetical protein [Vibrio chagasii]
MKLLDKNIIDILISMTIYLLSCLVPSRRNRWVLSARGGEKYCDNSRYFFEWLSNYKKSEECYWVTKNKHEIGNENFLYFYDIRSWLKIASCHYIVCSHSTTGNDVYKFVNKKKKLINLWHGIPLKKMGVIKKRKWIPFKSEPDLFLVPSSRDVDIFNSSYGISRTKFYIGQYPRVINLKARWERESKEILYAPTFRDGQTTSYYLNNVFPSCEALDALNEFLVDKGFVLNVKLHPYSHSKFPESIHRKAINIISPDEDIQDYLVKANILITDYSSIYLDYINVEGSVIFYLPDLEWYIKDENRGFVSDFTNLIGEKRAYNEQELINTIVGLINSSSEYKKEEEIFEYFYENANSTNEDLFKKIKNNG